MVIDIDLEAQTVIFWTLPQKETTHSSYSSYYTSKEEIKTYPRHECSLVNAYLDAQERPLYLTFRTSVTFDPTNYDSQSWEYGTIPGGMWMVRRDIQPYFDPWGAFRLTIPDASQWAVWNASVWLFLRSHAKIAVAQDECGHGPPVIYQWEWQIQPDTVIERLREYFLRIKHPLDLGALYTDFYELIAEIDEETAKQLSELQQGESA